MKFEYVLWALAFIGIICSYAGGKLATLMFKEEKTIETVKMIFKTAGVVVAAGAVVILFLRGNIN